MLIIQFVLTLALVFYNALESYNVRVNHEYFEDNSGRITLTYCLPLGYCSNK